MVGMVGLRNCGSMNSTGPPEAVLGALDIPTCSLSMKTNNITCDPQMTRARLHILVSLGNLRSTCGVQVTQSAGGHPEFIDLQLHC